MELRAVKDSTNIENIKTNLRQITKERDFLHLEVEKRKKENEKLKIENNKSKGDLSYEIEIAVKKEKEKLMEKIENLKLENERKIFEINDLEMKLKQKTALCGQL